MLYGTDITGCGERQMAVRQCVCPAVRLLGDRGGTKEEEKAKQEGQSIPQKGPTDMFKGRFLSSLRPLRWTLGRFWGTASWSLVPGNHT